ncbi:hypothetical protein JAAARDRAFT_56703 [Jaapia argillacea MUCL 33604]|uniref:MYND-type domain-containing protein n=1 Tax=Jaapia argillacea MUCL 33604 TaxID=933084 RepID=A0A067Q0R5_9AGAM|nr:hypothetical protein JAAARDRAFT_56703 [Jaapia argillacea MUCL 33604]
MERNAKLGSTLGPLDRTCEGEGCGRMVGREVESLSTCAACKMAFYCSHQCQRASWGAHKEVCGTWDQLEQGLPSAAAIRQFILDPVVQEVFLSVFCDD